MDTPAAGERPTLTAEQASVLLRRWRGPGVALLGVTPLEGGIESPAYRLDFDKPPCCAVVKLQAGGPDDPLPRERVRLGFLREHTRVPCPEVYLQDASRTVLPYSFLLLECLPGQNLQSAGLQPGQRVTVERELAEALAELHSHRRDTFGSMDEPGSGDWVAEFVPQLAENRQDVDALLALEILADVDRALELAPDALKDQGPPTLIHNDVWGGNIVVVERADGWHLSGLIDPVGMNYADVEKELAYLQVWDTVRRHFFNHYGRLQPLRPGYENRRPFYWLHALMVEVWLGLLGDLSGRVHATAREILVGHAR